MPLVGNKAPAIDGRIVLAPYRDAKGHRRMGVSILNDNYPSIEVYYDPSGDKGPRKLCKSREGSPIELAGTPNERCKSAA